MKKPQKIRCGKLVNFSSVRLQSFLQDSYKHKSDLLRTSVKAMEDRQYGAPFVKKKEKKCSLHKKHGERKVIIFVREGERRGGREESRLFQIG